MRARRCNPSQLQENGSIEGPRLAEDGTRLGTAPARLALVARLNPACRRTSSTRRADLARLNCAELVLFAKRWIAEN